MGFRIFFSRFSSISTLFWLSITYFYHYYLYCPYIWLSDSVRERRTWRWDWFVCFEAASINSSIYQYLNLLNNSFLLGLLLLLFSSLYSILSIQYSYIYINNTFRLGILECDLLCTNFIKIENFRFYWCSYICVCM